MRRSASGRRGEWRCDSVDSVDVEGGGGAPASPAFRRCGAFEVDTVSRTPSFPTLWSFLKSTRELLKSPPHVEEEGVWPYFVATGFLLTPPIDTEESDWREALRRLKRAWRTVVEELVDV